MAATRFFHLKLLVNTNDNLVTPYNRRPTSGVSIVTRKDGRCSKGIGNKFVDLHQDNAQAHASIFTQEVLESKGVGFLGILRAVQMSLAVSEAEKSSSRSEICHQSRNQDGRPKNFQERS